MGTQDTVAIPFLIIVLLCLTALAIRSWYRLKQNKPLFPGAKRHIKGFVAAFLLFAVFGIASHTISFLIIALIGLPASGVMSWYRLKQGKAPLPKQKRYSATITGLFLLLIFAVVVASREHIVLFPSNLPTAVEWLGGGVFLAVILTRIHFGWRKLKTDRKQALLRILPENRSELWIWAAVSIMAGVAEECVYRGVAYNLLWKLTGSVDAAIAICVLAFGISHMTQGWKAAVWVGLLGLIFHFAVILTGTLYVAIAMHAAYDFFLGLLVIRLLDRDKIEAGPQTQPAPLAQD